MDNDIKEYWADMKRHKRLKKEANLQNFYDNTLKSLESMVDITVKKHTEHHITITLNNGQK